MFSQGCRSGKREGDDEREKSERGKEREGKDKMIGIEGKTEFVLSEKERKSMCTVECATEKKRNSKREYTDKLDLNFICRQF